MFHDDPNNSHVEDYMSREPLVLVLILISIIILRKTYGSSVGVFYDGVIKEFHKRRL